MDYSNQFNLVKDSVVAVLSLNGKKRVSSGSGVLIGDGTYVLTCSHCIIYGTDTACFTSGSNNGIYGDIVFNNADIDIAIIKLVRQIGDGVTLGNSTIVEIGHESFIAGFPFHTFPYISTFSSNISGFKDGKILIDASVNHGNSGGPLFNKDGQLIGIVNAKLGGISDVLRYIENIESQNLLIGGINPTEVFKKIIQEMKRNLNLGIGTAIPIHVIGSYTSIIKELME